MALESLTGPSVYINSLVNTNPTATDNKSEGDDHLRGIKNVILNTFPNINAAVNLTDEQLNLLVGLTAAAAELNILDGALLSTAELNKLNGVTASTTELNLLAGLLASTAELNILNGILATTLEINTTCDGSTAATATTVAGADSVPFNDAGVMKQVAMTDLDTYFSATTKTLTNKTLTTPVISNPTGLDKNDVGLNNVDNTSDATKNAATATLLNKTLTSPTINSPTITAPIIDGVAASTIVILDTPTALAPGIEASWNAITANASAKTAIIRVCGEDSVLASSDTIEYIGYARKTGSALAAGASTMVVRANDFSDATITNGPQIGFCCEFTVNCNGSGQFDYYWTHTGTTSMDVLTMYLVGYYI